MKIRAKKSLGQNFLIDDNLLKRIVVSGDINKDSHVLEIGPGTGNLTRYILKKNPRKVFVIEKDNNLSEILNKEFGDKINIINEDVLKVSEHSISNQKLIVFGNLPYNISTEILSKWIVNLNKDYWFTKLILMFQKEVADRIIAKHNTSKYGRLSILSDWKLSVEKITDITPSSFSPKPKIDSSLLIFFPKNNFFNLKHPKNLELVTRVFFNQRRKMIKKPFKQLFNNSEKISKKLGIDLNLRPQNLSTKKYLEITQEFEDLRG